MTMLWTRSEREGEKERERVRLLIFVVCSSPLQAVDMKTAGSFHSIGVWREGRKRGVLSY